MIWLALNGSTGSALAGESYSDVILRPAKA
jgi:hypothetical protein